MRWILELRVMREEAGSSARNHKARSEELARLLDASAHQAGQFSVLGPDPWQILWGARNDAGVAFLEATYALVSWRSPIGPTEQARAAVLEALIELASTKGKALFVLGTDRASSHAGQDRGLRSFPIGYETFLDLSDWSLKGRRREKIRLAMNSAHGKGISWREAHPASSVTDAHGLEAVEMAWKRERRERAVDSILRTSFRELIGWRRYFVAECDSVVVASITCAPVSRRGWYLQDPVRLPTAPRGALEGAMALALDTFHEEGCAFASNGILPFWNPSGATQASDELGLLGRQLVRLFDRRYRFAGINQFRSKFEPDWTEPVSVLWSPGALRPHRIWSLTKILG